MSLWRTDCPEVAGFRLLPFAQPFPTEFGDHGAAVTVERAADRGPVVKGLKLLAERKRLIP
jgi:hypothetical protein